ncbi:hypothetical protein [Trabulsiella odontotermitis]|uniref:hypothetical protein n=1 Tax=Trabulsiella odontotermitis TaxID=379893 RepID=UPI0006BA41E9|nr:hypothetical protein [Trabulsiella odontotermitis]
MDDNIYFDDLIKSTRSRRGSFGEIKLPANLVRDRCISVRLNEDELSLLDNKRGDLNRAEWLRMASLHKLPTIVPSVNIDTWKTLTEISQKLNKLLAHIENKSKESTLTKTELFAVKRQISDLRMKLISGNFWEKSSEENVV